jgi:hypothetical protein
MHRTDVALALRRLVRALAAAEDAAAALSELADDSDEGGGVAVPDLHAPLWAIGHIRRGGEVVLGVALGRPESGLGIATSDGLDDDWEYREADERD